MQLVKFSLAASLCLPFVFKESGQAIAVPIFSNEEYASIHYIYGYCDSNA